MVNGYFPETLAEALEIRRDETVRIFAGGTDLMVKHRRGAGRAPRFDHPPLFLGRVPECRGIVESADGLRIGSTTTLTEIEEDSRTPALLQHAILQMAAPAVRNVATLGGNVGNASPAGDTLPPLYVMDATVILGRLENGVPMERDVPLDDFITGPGKTRLRKNEIITAITIPACAPSTILYHKVATRKAAALAKISIAAQATVSDGALDDLRLAVGAAAPTVIRSKKLEALAIGARLDGIGAVAAEMMNGYSHLLDPIDDQRSTAAYRMDVALRLIKDFVTIRAWRPNGKVDG